MQRLGSPQPQLRLPGRERGFEKIGRSGTQVASSLQLLRVLLLPPEGFLLPLPDGVLLDGKTLPSSVYQHSA